MINKTSNLENYIISKKDKIKISSKEIRKGDVFLALKGKNFHGNKFINTSLKKGAKFCITDNTNYKKNEKVIFVKDLFDYLKYLALKKRDLYKGDVIGITGSAGKTTLKETLAYFLKKNYIISYSKKSYNNQLGVLISLLNLNLNSSYSIFEIGTNNFGEIKELTKIVRPKQIFITNIQSTHLENFKTQNNIAIEKSDIFNSKYNKYGKKLYLNINTKSEEIIIKKSKREKKIKVIQIEKNSKKYFIKKITLFNGLYNVCFSINKKNINFKTKSIIMFRLINILFCYAFFNENALLLNTITKYQKYLKPVSGRGLKHKIIINKKIIKVIDESYNANPDTMLQSIDYFKNIKKSYRKKILILGNMNELGHNTNKLHLDLLNQIEMFNWKFIILCGEFLQTSIKKLKKPKNEFFYIPSKNKIMKFLTQNIDNKDMILIKCSNSTEVNKFANNLLKKVI